MPLAFNCVLLRTAHCSFKSTSFVPGHTSRPHVLPFLAAAYGHVMEVSPMEHEGMGMGHHQVRWRTLQQAVGTLGS